MNPLTQSKNTTILPVLITLMLTCFALAPSARAVDPPPDGGYPNQNTAEGEDALFSLTTGTDNTAIGFDALLDDTSGGFNTATGSEALERNRKGAFNTAVGAKALWLNTNHSDNTAVGYLALSNNVLGSSNTAVGSHALSPSVIGSFNTAIGDMALGNNTQSNYNTAVGYSAGAGTGSLDSLSVAVGYLALKDGGFSCVAVGANALTNNTGQLNTAIGENSMEMNTTGDFNTAGGWESLKSNTTGAFNTAFGLSTLVFNQTGNNNTALGDNALFNNTGSNNIGLGTSGGSALTTGSDNVDIANAGVAGESGIIHIGTAGTQTATYIAGIAGVPLGVGRSVGVSADGQLGVKPSSARFKEAIQSMDKVSEAVLSLRPVTFRYKHNLDPKGTRQFGLVAEEVAKIDRDLVGLDAQGKPFTVRYEEVNAMLLNEFLKEHRKGQEQDATISQLKAELAQQQKEIKALSAQIQKVSAQIEASQTVQQVVNNNQ